MKKDPEFQGKDQTKIGLHAISNMFEVDRLKNSTEMAAKQNDIDCFGLNLSNTQMKVLEGILHGFTMEKYKTSSKKVTFAGETVNVPYIKVKQKQLLEWSKIDPRNPSQKTKAIDALDLFSKKMFYLEYDRLIRDDNRNPVKDKNNRYQKEKISTVGPIFFVRKIMNSKTNKVDYYEIGPSQIFFDEIDSHFLILPNNWREEVSHYLGNSKSIKYVNAFLIYLRAQFEIKRRYNRKLTLSFPPEKIAKILNIPESIYVRKKKRMREILSKVYTIAKELNYLEDFMEGDETDTLILNNKKYILNTRKEISSQPKLKLLDSPNMKEELKPEAEVLFDFFHDTIRELDPSHINPNSLPKTTQIKSLNFLLNERPIEEIKKLISWGLKKPFWSSQIGTPGALRKNFSKAYREMLLDSKTPSVAANRNIAENIKRKLGSIPKNIVFEIFNQHVELGIKSHPNRTIISLSEKTFEGDLLYALKRHGLNFK